MNTTSPDLLENYYVRVELLHHLKERWIFLPFIMSQWAE